MTTVPSAPPVPAIYKDFMKRQTIFRFVLVYLLLGGLWLAASDTLLKRLVNDSQQQVLLRSYAGWFFAAVSALVLVIFFMAREFRTHKQTETARLVSEEKYRQLVLGANDGIIIADAVSGDILEVNRRMEGLVGLPAETIIGRNMTALFPERQRVRYRELFTDLIRNTKTLANDLCIAHHEGREIPVELSASIVELNDKKLLQGIFRDISRRLMAEEQARYRLEHLSTLHAINMIINASLDLYVTLEKFLDLVISQLHVDAADVLLLNPHTQMLEYAALQGFRDTRILHTRLRLGQGIAGRAALERRSISIPDLLDPASGYERAPFLKGEGYLAYHVVPLISKGQVKGVLEVFHRSPLTFDDEWTRFLHALAAHAAIAIDNAVLFSDLQRSNAELMLAYDTSIEGWARALELRDKETEGHTKRAADMTLRIARAMGMSDPELVHVRRGALLHDIGKMSIPDTVLLKAGPLTTEEWEIMRRHPVYAYELLSPIAYLRQALDIPYCHHERWDGTGYPRGLKGDQIPLAARIFALADTWDALVSERRYHSAWSEERVLGHIRFLMGSQFDPNVVEVFLSMELKDRFEDFGAATE
jgi:PAS domain S-box-containing protein/putative nucleotidyltransferase with HDIG domain